MSGSSCYLLSGLLGWVGFSGSLLECCVELWSWIPNLIRSKRPPLKGLLRKEAGRVQERDHGTVTSQEKQISLGVEHKPWEIQGQGMCTLGDPPPSSLFQN